MAFHFESTEISTKRAREDDLTDVLGSAKKGKTCNGGPYELHIGGMEVDMDCEMEGDTEGMGGLLSNPDHRWETTAAPRMLHHASSNSLSSYATGSAPGTPIDFPEQYAFPTPTQTAPTPLYPSTSNPGAFTSFSEPMPKVQNVCPPPERELDAAAAFAAYALTHGFKPPVIAMGMIPMQAQGGGYNSDGMVQSIDIPGYGWDCPKQAFGKGSHLV